MNDIKTENCTFLTGADLLRFCKYGDGPVFNLVDEVFLNCFPSRPRPARPLPIDVFDGEETPPGGLFDNKVIASLANSIASSSLLDELYLRLPSRFRAESSALSRSFEVLVCSQTELKLPNHERKG